MQCCCRWWEAVSLPAVAVLHAASPAVHVGGVSLLFAVLFSFSLLCRACIGVPVVAAAAIAPARVDSLSPAAVSRPAVDAACLEVFLSSVAHSSPGSHTAAAACVAVSIYAVVDAHRADPHMALLSVSENAAATDVAGLGLSELAAVALVGGQYATQPLAGAELAEARLDADAFDYCCVPQEVAVAASASLKTAAAVPNHAAAATPATAAPVVPT